MQRDNPIRANFNYTRDDGSVPEVYFYEPPPGTVVHQPGNDPHVMPITDGWSRAGTFSLDREGFALKEFRHSFDRFDDDEPCAASSTRRSPSSCATRWVRAAWSCSTTPSARRSTSSSRPPSTRRRSAHR